MLSHEAWNEPGLTLTDGDKKILQPKELKWYFYELEHVPELGFERLSLLPAKPIRLTDQQFKPFNYIAGRVEQQISMLELMRPG